MTEAHKWSFWSINKHKVGGIAILLHPFKTSCFEQVEHQWTSKTLIAVESGDMKLVNIYALASADKAVQDQFFASLADLIRPNGKMLVVGGDFDCVVQRGIDRHHIKFDEPASTESTALEHTINKLELCESLVGFHCRTWSREDEERYRERYYTFGTAEHGRRLDRFYISSTTLEYVNQQEARDPVNYSDHMEYVLE